MGTHAIHSVTDQAHLDLKLENILVDANDDIRICDFSCAQPLAETQYQRHGTPDYMSPEAYSTKVNKDGYSGLKADIFSLGMILFFLAFG
jgi:serine/threonine protein kinase